jgi:hypothetical protein
VVMQGPAKPSPAVRFRSRPPKTWNNYSPHTSVTMKIKIPFMIIFSDLILPYIARNIKKIALIASAIFIGIFITLYAVDKNQKANEALLVQYLSAINDINEGNNSSAMTKLEKVYNSSNKLLELLALMQIIDISINEEQYKVLPKLLEEILSLKLNTTQSLIAYSKAVTVIEIMNDKNVISQDKTAKFTKILTEKLQKLKVPSSLTPNKNALLIALGQPIPSTEIANEKASSTTNQLSTAIELMK